MSSRSEIDYNSIMRSLKLKWIVVFLMLWLPMQGMAAAVFSVCIDEKTDSLIDSKLPSSNDHHHDACHKQAPEKGTTHPLPNFPCNDSVCDIFSITLILTEQKTPLTTNKVPMMKLPRAGFTSFVPEQLQRPPLTFPL